MYILNRYTEGMAYTKTSRYLVDVHSYYYGAVQRNKTAILFVFNKIQCSMAAAHSAFEAAQYHALS